MFSLKKETGDCEKNSLSPKDIMTNQEIDNSKTVCEPAGDGIGGTAKDEILGSLLEDSNENFDELNDVCSYCREKYKQPRVLSCLHVFCLPCLEKEFENRNAVIESNTNSLHCDPKAPPGIVCKTCEQLTILGLRGPSVLPHDYIMIDHLDMSAIVDRQIICTSCKAKEKAVARCSDCANFLCPNCVTAHQYMRCFENHTVVSFEDIQNGEGVPIHKPIYCPDHPSENLKCFCNTCQVPICNECMMDQHKPPMHFHERISCIEEKQINDLRELISECKRKMEQCEDVSGSLHNSLMEQQLQRDSAKKLIQDTFEIYKALIEKKKAELLTELEERHASQELQIMETFHNVEKTLEKINDACAFTERVLKHGNAVQILLLKKQIYMQLMSLINKPLKPDVAYDIEFITDAALFTDMINKFFGTFKDPNKSTEPENQLGISAHILGGGDARVMPAMQGPDFSNQVPLSNVNAMVGIRGVTPGVTSVIPGSEGSCVSRNSQSPAMSDSGISLDASTSSYNVNSGPLLNVAQLSKYGSVGINNNGQVTLNGTVIPGVHMNNVLGLSAKLGGRSSSSSPTDASIVPLNVGSISSRSQTPGMDSLINVIQQPSPSLSNTMSNMTNIGVFQAPNENECGNAGGINSGDSQFSSSLASSQSMQPRRPNGKMSSMQIRCKFGQLGPTKGQFNSPHGFCLGSDEDIVVADTNNHRIQIFHKNGDFKSQFGIPGREEGQLWYPRKVAVIRPSGKYVVCDRGAERSRMQVFTKNGHFIRKIAIRYIDIVAGLAITQEGNILAVDSVSPTVFCISENGDLLKWFDCSDYMREPSDIAISGKEYFVCDFKGHCVVVFSDTGDFLRRIGCESITNYPNGIDISDAGDVLVGDSHGNRFHVAVFQRDGSLIGEFECPYVKVSRCCGLKITSEGYVVTLAKNNHHVLVLNTLYIA